MDRQQKRQARFSSPPHRATERHADIDGLYRAPGQLCQYAQGILGYGEDMTDTEFPLRGIRRRVRDRFGPPPPTHNFEFFSNRREVHHRVTVQNRPYALAGGSPTANSTIAGLLAAARTCAAISTMGESKL